MELRGARGFFWALVASVLASSAGCVGERDPINRVQANAVPKSFFLGSNLADYKDDPEFRTKTFNIDSAVNTDNYAGSVGRGSAVDRVRFEVTENHLLVRRSYQETPGADKRALPRVEVSAGKFEFPGPPTGTIIAAYKVQKHFDVRRSYNPQTGEEANTIEENETDRPWQQREYMRVDWSTNLVQSTSGNADWVFGEEGATVAALEYNVTSENEKEDRPNFDVNAGYFDVTNKYTLSPAPISLWGLPECVIIGYFNGTSSFDCTPAEVKVRHSFVKLTGKEDFEPFEESYAQRDIIGNWGNVGNNFTRDLGSPPITAWDPQYGFTDAKTKTFYTLHNLWEKSHQEAACGSNADVDADGTADDCLNEITGYGGSSGSQCDVHVGRCTIPVRDRSVKTIGYWLNADAPADLADEVSEDGKSVVKGGAYEEVTHTWNQLVRVAIATRREVECRRTKSGDRQACHDLYFDSARDMVAFGGWGIPKTKDLEVDGGKPAVTTCHNPVRAYDPASCGKPGEASRLGDIRKNYAIYWPHASRAPYGGVGSIGADPLTGEIVGATATTMMRSATLAAGQQRDIIQLALGDVKMDDLIQGVQASRYADRVQNGQVTDAFTKAKTPGELAALANNVDLASVQAAVGETPAELAAMPRASRHLATAKARALSSPATASIAAANARFEGLLAKVTSTEYRADLANKGLLKLLAESSDKSTSVYQAIGAFADKDPSRIQEIFDQYQSFLGSKGICFHDSAVAAGAGSIYQASLAPYFRKLYGGLDAKERGVRIYKDLVREAAKGISFHEVGHSIGMRHNFASSWDAMNYNPQYWQLRTNEGQSTAKCAAPRTSGPDNCMGPRYVDPMTDDEQGNTAAEPRPGIEYFANTSTMEYQIERFGETAGAGSYDLHMMKTLYGRVLETFDSNDVKPEDQQYFAVKMLSQGISRDMVYDAQKGFGTHYTTTAVRAKVFDPRRDCRDATAEEKEVAKWRIVHGKVCAQSPRNHLAYEDMKSSEIAFKVGAQTAKVGVTGIRWSGADETKKTLVRWPYRYGEDYSRGGYIHAKPGDSGADVYEITQNVIKRFDNTYPWAYFRRQNREFAWWSLPSVVAGNTFARLRGYHWTTTTDIGRSTPEELQDDDLERPSVVAAADMFNFLQRVILTPEPGTYGLGVDSRRRTPTRAGAAPILDLLTDQEKSGSIPQAGELGIVDGRFVQVDFDSFRGGSWDYWNFPIHAPFDEEKVLALRELVDARPTLSTVSRDNAIDGRDPYISFRTDTPHAIDRLLGSLLSEDWEVIAPSLSRDGTTHEVFSVLERDPSKLVRGPNSGILFPNIGYSSQIGSGIYALLFSRFSTDMVLAQKMRIRYEGDAGLVIPDARKAAFTDPITGHRYLAMRYPAERIGGRDIDTGIGSRMLQHANDLLGDAYELVAGAPNAFGERTVVVNANGEPVVKNAAVVQTLRRYIGLLDGMRQVGNILGGGPLGGGGGGDEE